MAILDQLDLLELALDTLERRDEPSAIQEDEERRRYLASKEFADKLTECCTQAAKAAIGSRSK